MKFPRRRHLYSEADVMGDFYYQARKAGFGVYLEVQFPSARHRSGFMRVDGVVVEADEEMICFVETKRPGKAIPYEGRQYEAYRDLERTYGIPTLWIGGFNDVRESVEWLLSEPVPRNGGVTAAPGTAICKQEPGKTDALQVMVDGA